MVQMKRTRKLRKGGGWFSRAQTKSNTNTIRNAQNALGKIKETNARTTVKNKAKTSAANRRDFKTLEDKKDKLIIKRRNDQIEIDEIEKKQKLIVYEEEKKEAEKWIARMEKKPGWFS